MTAKSQTDQYDEYAAFFSGKLPGAERDLLSGRLMICEKNKWLPVGNRIDLLKSHAVSSKLKKDDVQIHLSRYEHSFEKKLLIKEGQWDGVDRIHEMRDFIKFEKLPFEVFEDTIKQWGANTFRRLENPSNQNVCPVFKGDQGLGKDYFIEKLTAWFNPYYAKLTSNNNEVEIWRQITSKIIMHIPEFDQTSKISVPFLKDIITRDYVELRPLYAQDYETYPCYTSFISSANIDNMLRDTTGNRRFMIYDVASIVKRNYPADWSAQIYAQFKNLYQQNFWANAESIAQCSRLMEEYKPENVEDMILEFWDERVSKVEIKDKSHGLTFGQVQFVIADIAKAFNWKPQTISFLLRRNGCKVRIGGNHFFYQRPKKATPTA